MLAVHARDMVMGAPRMFATAYDSLGLQVDRRRRRRRRRRGRRSPRSACCSCSRSCCRARRSSLSRGAHRAARRCAGCSAGPRAARRGPAFASGRHARRGGLRRVHVVAQRRLRADPAGRARHAVGGRDVGDARSRRGRPAWTPQREQEHGREPTVRERRAEEPGTIGPVGEDEEEIAPPATTTSPAESRRRPRPRPRPRPAGRAAGRDHAGPPRRGAGARAPGRDDPPTPTTTVPVP